MNIPLVDTHAHICDSAFDADLAVVLERALQGNVIGIVAVGENIKDARKNLDLAENAPIVKPAAGLYPTHTDLDSAEEMITFIREHHRRLFAIGEVGLDFWVVQEKEQREIQKEIFSSFIKLSLGLDLPLNVHSRSAGRHALNMLLDMNAERVQMHAFDGKASYANYGVEAGFFFSVPPSLVRSQQKQKLVKQLPMESLLLETDSPVLGPDPKTRNEPANLLVAAQAIADIKGESLEKTLHVIKENTLRLYGDQLFGSEEMDN